MNSIVPCSFTSPPPQITVPIPQAQEVNELIAEDVRENIRLLRLEELYPDLTLQQAILAFASRLLSKIKIKNSPDEKVKQLACFIETICTHSNPIKQNLYHDVPYSNALCQLLAHKELLHFHVADILKYERVSHLPKLPLQLTKDITILSSLVASTSDLFKKMIGSLTQEEAHKLSKGIDQIKNYANHLTTTFAGLKKSGGKVEILGVRINYDSKRDVIEGEPLLNQLKHLYLKFKPRVLESFGEMQEELKNVTACHSLRKHENLLLLAHKIDNLNLSPFKIVDFLAQLISEFQILKKSCKPSPASKPSISLRNLDLKNEAHLELTLKLILDELTSIHQKLAGIQEVLQPVLTGLTHYVLDLAERQQFAPKVYIDWLWLDVLDEESSSRKTQHSPSTTYEETIEEEEEVVENIPLEEAVPIPPAIELKPTFFGQADALYDQFKKGFIEQESFQKLSQSPFSSHAKCWLADFQHHLYQSLVGLELTHTALQKGRVRALAALVPGMLFDLSICFEAVLSLKFLETTQNFCKTHSLAYVLKQLDLYQALPQEIRAMIEDFDQANVWSRYLHSYHEKLKTSGKQLQGLKNLKNSHLILQYDKIQSKLLSSLMKNYNKMFKDLITAMASLLKVDAPPLDIFVLCEEIPNLRLAPRDPLIEKCIRKLDVLSEKEPSVLYLDCQESLMQLDETFWLACENPQPHSQALLLRNSVLRLSLAYELMLTDACQTYMLGHIATHHFPLFFKDLPDIADRDYILQFSDWSKIAQYPHRWPNHDLVNKLLTLESKGKPYRHAEEGFQIQGCSPSSEFVPLIHQMRTKGIQVLEKLIDLIHQTKYGKSLDLEINTKK